MLYSKKYYKNEVSEWVVFIHGAGGSSSIWFRQLKEFKKHFNLLLVDLRGHGRSAGILEDYYKKKYTFKSVSTDVLQVLKKNDINKAHFVGVSLGTIIIRTIADMKPEIVQSSVLCGAITRMNTRSRILVWLGHTFKRVVPFMWLYKLFAWIILPRKNHQETRTLFIQDAKKLAQKEFLKWFRLTYDINPLLRYFKEQEINAPTLYIMGSEDHMFLPPVKKMVQNSKKSYLQIIENCGHVCNVEKPDQFNKYSIQFLKKQSSYLHDPV